MIVFELYSRLEKVSRLFLDRVSEEMDGALHKIEWIVHYILNDFIVFVTFYLFPLFHLNINPSTIFPFFFSFIHLGIPSLLSCLAMLYTIKSPDTHAHDLLPLSSILSVLELLLCIYLAICWYEKMRFLITLNVGNTLLSPYTIYKINVLFRRRFKM